MKVFKWWSNMKDMFKYAEQNMGLTVNIDKFWEAYKELSGRKHDSADLLNLSGRKHDSAGLLNLRFNKDGSVKNTYKKIGNKLGLSGERVGQLCRFDLRRMSSPGFWSQWAKRET